MWNFKVQTRLSSNDIKISDIKNTFTENQFKKQFDTSGMCVNKINYNFRQ